MSVNTKTKSACRALPQIETKSSQKYQEGEVLGPLCLFPEVPLNVRRYVRCLCKYAREQGFLWSMFMVGRVC